MATIIPFKHTESRRPMGGGFSGMEHSAEIVIFPGVRIERWGDETAPHASHDDEDDYLDPEVTA